MGAVYEGFDTRLDRRVAIKILPVDAAAHPDAIIRFEREAKAMAALDHPNILHIHDFGSTADGHPFLIMEFIDGTDVHRLRQAGQLDLPGALEIISQVCSALAYAHACGIVHRDIKPANILVTREGVVKVADFGLAKILTTDSRSPHDPTLTRSGASMGSPAYMAPEQFAGEKVDHRADIFSLGVMLYELLTGAPPWGAWPPPSQSVRIDVRLDEIVLRALQQNPAARYQAAAEVREDIDSVKSSTGGGPLPPGARPEPLPSNRRNATPASTAASSATPPPPAVSQPLSSQRGKKPNTIRSLARMVLILGLPAIAIIAALAVYRANRNQTGEMAPKAPAQPAPDLTVTPAKGFGMQTDPDHQRKLAEAMLDRNAGVWIWNGEAELQINHVRELPKSRVYLRSIEAVGKPFTDDDAMLLNGCADLVSLKLQNAVLEDLPFDSLKSLEILYLMGVRLPPDALLGIRGSKSIRDIHLSEFVCDNVSGLLDTLATCPNLEAISLYGMRLRGCSLQPLAKLKSLRSLDLRTSDASDDELSALAGFPALESLNLEGTNLADSNLAWLAGLKTVTGLSLNRCHIPEGTSAHVASMPALQSLDLGGQTVSPADFRKLGGNKTISTLFLGDVVTGEHFVGLKPMPGMTLLDARNTAAGIDDAGAKALAAAFPNLKQCIITAKGLGPDGCNALGTLRELTTLHLNECDRELAATVAGIKTLTNVALTGSDITNAEVARLEPLKSSLTALLLPNTRIDDAAEATLAGFRHLQCLEIVGTKITKDCVARLKEALPACRISY
ncbi:MAG: serine/threonine protein kinase [Akkermansiaceae bacterium]|nr:serine/threonine protein kinase [Akkermansiaceae bacterium]